MGRLGNLLFLAGLAFSALTLPRHLQKFLPATGIPFSNPTAALPQLPGGVSGDVYVIQQETLDIPMPEELGSSSADFSSESAPAVEIQMNPLMGKMLEASRNSKKKPPLVSVGLKWREWLVANGDVMAAWAWRLPLGLIVFSLAACLMGWKGAGRSGVMLCYSLCGKWMFLISFTAIVFFIWQKVNLWSALPGGVWQSPILGIAACLLFLRFLDMNYPIWNSAVKTFLAPITACLIIFFWDKATLMF